MSNLFQEFYLYFFDKKFELAHIGELSSYTYDELCIHLNYFKQTVEFDNSAMVVTWESARTILTIKYDLNKKFIKKVNEVWK